MSPRKTWVGQRTDVLLREIGELGLTVPRPVAEDVVRKRLGDVAARMRITEQSARRYVTDKVLTQLAQEMAFILVDEAPGADLETAPRTAALTIELAGRAVTALAEATQLRLYAYDKHEEIRLDAAPFTQAMSALGTLINESPPDGPVMSPPYLLRRISRYLDIAAEQARQGVLPTGLEPEVGPHLADALERDALKLRAAADL